MDALDPAERKKIIEIMKEKERNVPSMDWMYTKTKPDTEEYLLGKKVDKAFETKDQQEETIPQSEVFGERIKANITLDMQAKMREDPLFAIKKVEEESRRKLLQNPIKMKQLKKMIEQQNRAKRKKKHKKHGSDSEDDELISKYLSILSKKHSSKHEKQKKSASKGAKYSKHDNCDSKRSERKLSNQSSGDDSDVYKNKHSKKHLSKHRHRSEERESSLVKEKISRSSGVEYKRQRYNSSSSEDSQPKQYGLIKMESSLSKKYDPASSRSRSPKTTSDREQTDTHRSSDKHHSRSPVSRSKQRDNHSRHPVKSKRERSPPKRKLTAEEREKKLAEMMENAKWREEQRRSNVKHYEIEDRKKEKYDESSRGSSAKFLNPMLSKHAAESTIEDRIKRNKYNIQRRKADLEKNFTEK